MFSHRVRNERYLVVVDCDLPRNVYENSLMVESAQMQPRKASRPPILLVIQFVGNWTVTIFGPAVALAHGRFAPRRLRGPLP